MINNDRVPANAVLVVCREDKHGFWADGSTYEQISEWFFVSEQCILSQTKWTTWETWQEYFMRRLYVTGRGD